MFVPVRKRYLQVAVVVTLVIVVGISVLLSSTISQLKNLNYIDSLSLSIWSSGGTTHSSLSDPGLSFNKKVTDLLNKKKKEDLEDIFWVTDTEITTDQTEMKIPSFYQLPDEQRPDVQPFDPRFTLAFYYDHVRRASKNSKTVTGPFHWADWVDMRVLDSYLFNPNAAEKTCDMLNAQPYEDEKFHDKKGREFHETRPVGEFCVLDKDLPKDHDDGNRLRLGFNVKDYFGRMLERNVQLAGKAYLYTMAPIPRGIVYLANDGIYNMTPTEKGKLVHNGLVDSFMHETGQKSINTLKQFRKLKKETPSFKDHVVNGYQVELSPDDFKLKPGQVIEELLLMQKSGIDLTEQQRTYMESLQYSMAVESAPPKYFHEASIFETLVGEHYDWRFFGGVKLGSSEQIVTLHRMVRVWLSFCRKTGVTTWLAHGSLLSWYWNGVAFPWDNDVDVQVPVMDLQKLSLNYNQSIIVEDPEDGFGRYFLDCGTFITLREHANGNNNIDARFIDIDSGLYVDITALAISNDKAPDRYKAMLPQNMQKDEHSNRDKNEHIKVYNCRNFHFSSLSEISPLVRSYAEGEVAYIPKRYSELLTTEYSDKGLLQKYFKGRVFMPQLRLWLHQDDLRFFLRHRQQWLEYYLPEPGSGGSATKPKTEGELNPNELSALMSLKEEDFLDLLQNNHILMDYVLSRDMTSVHENEIMRLLFGKSTAQIVFLAPDFNPLKYEPFLYRMRHDYDTYEMEVARYEGLHKKYLEAKSRFQDEPKKDQDKE